MPPTKKKQTYIKLEPIDHVLKRSDVYIGSTFSKKMLDYTADENFKITKNVIDISPAFLRIFIEPLSNVVDNVTRSKGKNKVSKIIIKINSATGKTSFWNDGETIPIEIHDEEKCYNHTMIFGQLNTGSNYNDEEDRYDISGKNGIGIKAVNIFSKEFTVEGVDPKRKKYFKQTWTNNMKSVEQPEVKSSQSSGFTCVSYTPDFQKFGISGYTQEVLSLLKRYIIDVAMITKVPIFFNDEEIPVKSLEDYAKLFTDSSDILKIKFTKETKEQSEIVITPSNGEFETISFANGIFTPLGGVHVDSWSEALFRPIVEKFNKPNKPSINIADVKKLFRLFVVSSVNRPVFDSQSKLRLEAPAVDAEVKDCHVKKILKWEVIKELKEVISAKELIVLKKLERKTRGYQKVEGLEKANKEGGTSGYLCTLILVEGLSAGSYAVKGIEKGVFGKSGRDWFGIYCLRGKCKNVRNAKPSVIAGNKVISDIIKALGLKYDVDYTNDEAYKKLRYGRVLLTCDADCDGIHISGLLQNMFHSLYPSLLKRSPPFFVSMQTPIVHVFNPERWFYDEHDYKEYVEQNKGKKINKKYYKGLGTSTDDDIYETFGQKLVEYKVDDTTDAEMDKAFHGKFADARKKWLEKYDPANKVIKWDKENKEETQTITYSQFINTEFIKFSILDCKRSIPHLMDGLKESQRKVLYTVFSRKGQKYSGKDIKVAQLASFVAAKTNYHHGEQNLDGVIAGMANSFVGSNNIPLLYRGGQFGSRAHLGDDCAAGRYIFTKLDMLTRCIFREEDDVLLDYIEDDGDKIEPVFYVPIIPMLLVNGGLGIGTGWSCNVPCFNPLDLIKSIKDWITGSLLPEIQPWYRSYKGVIAKESETKYVSWGNVVREGNKAVIDEIPVDMSINKCNDILESMMEEKKIISFQNYSSPNKVHFVIKEGEIDCTESELGLYSYLHTSNMVLFNENKLKKYANTNEIIDTYCKVRLDFYVKRKRYLLLKLGNLVKFLGNKKRFLEEVRDGIIKLFVEDKQKKKQSRKIGDIVNELEKNGYDKEIDDCNGDNEGDKGSDKGSDIEDEIESKVTKSNSGYNYLLKLQISSITEENIKKLQNDIESNLKKIDELSGMEEKNIWMNELHELEVVYKDYLKKLDEELTSKKKKVAKKVVKK